MAGITLSVNSKFNKQGFDQANVSLSSLGKTLTSMTSLVKGFGAAFAIKEVAQFSFNAVKGFGEIERSAIRAQASVGEFASRSLRDLSDSLAKISMSDTDTIFDITTQLGALGHTEPMIRKVITAANDFANATNQDITATWKLMLSTLDGSAGKLDKQVAGIDKLTEAELRQGKGLDYIHAQMGKVSEAMGEGTAQKIKNLTEHFGDLSDAIGEALAPSANPFIQFVDDIIVKWTEAISKATEYNNLTKKKDLQGGQLGGNDLVRETTLKIEKKGNELQSVKTGLKANLQGVEGADAIIANNAEVKRLTSELNALQKELRLMNQQAAKDSATRERKMVADAKVSDTVKIADFNPAAALDALNMMNFTLANAPILEEQWTDIFASAAAKQAEGPATGGGLGLNFNPLDVLGSFGEKLTPIIGMMDQFAGPLMQAIGGISSIVMLLNPLQTIISATVNMLAPVVDTILAPVIGAFTIIGQMLAKITIPILELLNPVIQLISSAFIFTYNYAIRPFANAIIWVLVTLNNMVATVVNAIVRALNKLPFVDIDWRMEKMDFDEKKLEKIDMEDLMAAGSTAIANNNSANSGSNNGASYTAVGDNYIYINFYNSYVNGNAEAISIALYKEIEAAKRKGRI